MTNVTHSVFPLLIKSRMRREGRDFTFLGPHLLGLLYLKIQFHWISCILFNVKNRSSLPYARLKHATSHLQVRAEKQKLQIWTRSFTLCWCESLQTLDRICLTICVRHGKLAAPSPTAILQIWAMSSACPCHTADACCCCWEQQPRWSYLCM